MIFAILNILYTIIVLLSTISKYYLLDFRMTKMGMGNEAGRDLSLGTGKWRKRKTGEGKIDGQH